MNTLTIQSESLLRLGVFFSLFCILAILEKFYPRRQALFPTLRRWRTNISISVLNTALARLLIPIAGVGAALVAQDRNMGLFNQIAAPGWAEMVLFLLAFDLTIYLQHRLFHRVPFLWRLHRMHHTDPDYDVTTGNRFHPLSILISGLIKTSLIALAGPTPGSVVVAEILLNATSMFNHSNLKLPVFFDRVLRLLIVTPDMHRLHHSEDPVEHNRNFGFNFPWWDRLLGTYMAQPKAGHEAMRIGIAGFQNTDSIQFWKVLGQPLKRD